MRSRKAKGVAVVLAIVVLGILLQIGRVGQTSLLSSSSTRSSISSDFCCHNGSLHGIALEMAHFSSPPGSASYNNTLGILQASKYFHLALPPRGIFMNVAENMAALLQGFGLKQWNAKQSKDDGGVLLMEMSYYAVKMQQQQPQQPSQTSDYICRTTFDCTKVPRIIIQSEQLQQVGKDHLKLLKECHELPLCAIWDFSDFHYQWAQQHGIADSVMLLPAMHQSLLLNKAYLEHGHNEHDIENNSAPVLPLSQRPLDVVFFGKVTKRRQHILDTLIQQQTKWKYLFEYTTNLSFIKDHYTKAKVCLIAHSYASASAGEYHRLNELATVTAATRDAGCVPVVEDFSDRIGIQAYHECGGVLFAPYKNILAVVEQVLRDIKNNPGSVEHRQESHFLWWDNSVRWRELLGDIF